MPIEILMPALSPTMTEGTLAKWCKKEGDVIESGDVIAEIETDKATMEIEAVDEGILGKIFVADGSEGVPVNQLLALLLEDGEDASTLDGYEVAAPVSAPAADDAAAKSPAPTETPTTNNQQPATASGERVFASPLAKRIAGQEGVDISQIAGTGPRGRVIKADIQDAIAGGGATAASGIVTRNSAEFTAIANSGMRKTIAKRLTESKQQVPHFYLSVDCEIDALLDARRQVNLAGLAKSDDLPPRWKLSVNDMVIKAVALGLRDIPAANASWTDAAIHQYSNVDVSVAVAIDGGLITPIVKNADQKSLVNISSEMKGLIKKAKAGKLAPEEYQGGGFSISNLGMYGIKSFNAIVNPPQGCILAVGAGEKRAIVAADGSVKSATVMSVTLSCDHRVVDGAVGAEFLGAFKQYIESPVMMMV